MVQGFATVRFSMLVSTALVYSLLFSLATVECSSSRQQAGARSRSLAALPLAPPPAVYRYRLVKAYPHDTGAFTEGLQYELRCGGGKAGGGAPASSCREVLWESTGLNGQSSVRVVDLQSGKVLRSRALPQRDFGEGLVRHGNRLYQLTWLSPRTWSYSVDNFSDAQLLATPLRDGWGATSTGRHLIVSNSTDLLTWLDPKAGLKAVRTVAVRDGGRPVPLVNELEWVDGLIYANVWTTDCIAQIDPATGAVVGWVLLQGLKQWMQEALGVSALGADVLNGIAWDQRQRRLFITGKLWPQLYQVELVRLRGAAAAAGLRAARLQCIVLV